MSENAFWAHGNPLVIAESIFIWLQFYGFALNVLDIGWYQYDFKIIRITQLFLALIFIFIYDIITMQ